MEYGKVVTKGKDFKVAICNYPSTIREGIIEYALVKKEKSSYNTIATFIASSEEEAIEKGLALAKENNLQ